MMFIENLYLAPTYYFVTLFVTILSIVLHELGHGLAATWQGDPTPRLRGHLTWNPVVHMGWLSLALAAVLGLAWGATPVTPRLFRNRRWGNTMVSFAGPAVNILLMVVAAMVLRTAPPADTGFGALMQLFWKVLLLRNVMLFLLNLIPVPPLDGFEVLEGFFDLGSFGHMLRRAGPLPLIIVIVIINTDAFLAIIRSIVNLLAPGTLN